MDFFHSLKQFLGLGKRDQYNNNRIYEDDNRYDQYSNDQRQPRGGVLFDSDDPMLFSILSSPLEMHRYFEHQMDEFMKNLFQFEEHGPFESFSFSESPNFPSIEDLNPDESEITSGSLRDRYLKPGYESAKSYSSPQKYDSDIDEKFHTKDLDLLLKDENTKRPSQPKSQFYGTTTQFKTIHHPDGRIETIKTIRDNQGNEERTVTHTFGDKEHTIITRIDKDGKEEITEHLVNLDSNNLNSFWAKDKEQPSNVGQIRTLNFWLSFDKFFK